VYHLCDLHGVWQQCHLHVTPLLSFRFPFRHTMAVLSPKIMCQAVKFVTVLVISSGMFCVFVVSSLCHNTSYLIYIGVMWMLLLFLCNVIVISGGWDRPRASSKKQVYVLLSLDKVQLFQDIICCVSVIDFCWKFQYICSWRSVNCFVIKSSVCLSALKLCVKSGCAYGLFRELLNENV